MIYLMLQAGYNPNLIELKVAQNIAPKENVQPRPAEHTEGRSSYIIRWYILRRPCYWFRYKWKDDTMNYRS